MDANDLIKVLLDRTQRLTDALDQNRDCPPLAVAIMEELLRDVRELQAEIFSDTSK